MTNPFSFLRALALLKRISQDHEDLLRLHQQELPRLADSLAKIADSLEKPKLDQGGTGRVFTPGMEDFFKWEQEEREKVEREERIEFSEGEPREGVDGG